MKQIIVEKVCGLCKFLDYQGWCNGTGCVTFKNQIACYGFIPADWITEIGDV